ncbi:MAG: hypothetical protein COT15_04315 [Candidatus Diapherotrites archaeon CG08_land_8_20_14_0_20_34_12]|nr:MAG: hypothetical protein COT15_04315 [Candidatus Diapherotrites archaeon CG08_land_8_20_14_0_20_34_12]
MGKLETLRDVMSIIRDFLLILCLLGLLVGLFVVIPFLITMSNTVQTQGLAGIMPMIGSLVAGQMGSTSGANSSGYSYAKGGQGKYTMDATTQQIFSDLSTAMDNQDLAGVSSKLDELESHFKSKGMGDAADLTKKTKTSMMSGDMTGAQTYGTQLMNLFNMPQ